MTQEAMKQALEALEKGVDGQTSVEMDEAITSLRQAIAELESQEQNFCPRCGKRTNDIHTCTPPQRTWVGLTDEEISQLWLCTSPYFDDLDFARAIEAKLKEKNT
jgi:hypothetical protein